MFLKTLVLIGGSGSGKSTLARQEALYSLEGIKMLIRFLGNISNCPRTV